MHYACVDCGSPLTLKHENMFLCQTCGRPFLKENGVWHFLPSRMTGLAKEEIAYHDHFEEDAEDVHQLSAWRNAYYHRMLWDAVFRLPPGSRILELGAGSGYDARRFLPDYALTASDVSPKTVERLLSHLPHPPVCAAALDAEHLPFGEKQFDGAYAVAMWHHLTEPKRMIDECARVLHPGGLLAIVMEPNATYFAPIKWMRPLLCRAARMHGHEVSHADAEMTGFTARGIAKCFDPAAWSSVEIRPAWLLAGWAHYGLEFLFRVFRLKRRILLPRAFEKMLVGFDELAFKIPGVKHLGWHWIVIARR